MSMSIMIIIAMQVIIIATKIIKSIITSTKIMTGMHIK